MTRPTLERTRHDYLRVWNGPNGSGQEAKHFYPHSRSYTGVTTPGYFGKRRTGSLPDNPYSMEEIRWSSSESYIQGFSSWTAYSERTLAVYYAGYSPLGNFHPSLEETTRNKAVLRLGKQASAVRFNAAQFLGERKQTANLLVSTANRLVRSALALKRGDLRSFMSALSLTTGEIRDVKRAWERVYRTPPGKRIASHWLEFVYGWRPLLQDAHDIAGILADRIGSDPEPEGVLRSRARTTQGFTRGDDSSLVRTSDVHTCQVSLKANYRLESEGRAVLARTGISNPALLAWELLPFSFVLDWLIPFGMYLESLTAFDGFTLTGGTTSVLQKAASARNLTVPTSGNEPGGNFGNWITHATGQVLVTETKFDRTVGVPSTEYTLRVRSPIGGNPVERFATAMSLLVVLFSPDHGKSAGSRQRI